MVNKSYFTIIALIFGMIALTGCESVNNTMNGMKQSISNIEMPSLDVFKAAGQAEDESVTCPPIDVVDDLGFLHQYMEVNGHQPVNKLASVVISNVNSACFVKNGTLIVDLEIAFTAGLGPAAQNWKMSAVSFAYPYFLAISTPEDDIIAKEIFQLSLTFEKDESGQFKNVSHIENIRQIIPLDGTYTPEYRKFMTGFQLTEEQLQYNQSLLRKDVSAQPAMAYSPAATAFAAKPEEEKKALSKAALMAPPLPLFKPPYVIPDAPTTQKVKAAPAPHVEEKDVTGETPHGAATMPETEMKMEINSGEAATESMTQPPIETVTEPSAAPVFEDVTIPEQSTSPEAENDTAKEDTAPEGSIPDLDFYEYGDDADIPAPPALP